MPRDGDGVMPDEPDKPVSDARFKDLIWSNPLPGEMTLRVSGEMVKALVEGRARLTATDTNGVVRM
jgi:hypothetical protein